LFSSPALNPFDHKRKFVSLLVFPFGTHFAHVYIPRKLTNGRKYQEIKAGDIISLKGTLMFSFKDGKIYEIIDST